MDYALAEVALISGGAAVVGPLLLSLLNNRQAMARERRAVDRQDEVAARVAEAAIKADQVARVAATVAADTKKQLDQIHTLVNSDMTAARQAELDQTRRALAVLMRLVDKDRAMGNAPSISDFEEIGRNQTRINDLEKILADRLAQLKASEAE
jgi:hypothetical protein